MKMAKKETCATPQRDTRAQPHEILSPSINYPVLLLREEIARRRHRQLFRSLDLINGKSVLNILNVVEKLEMQAKCDEIYFVRCQAKRRSRSSLSLSLQIKHCLEQKETLIETQRKGLIKLITLISSSIKKVDGCTSEFPLNMYLRSLRWKRLLSAQCNAIWRK